MNDNRIKSFNKAIRWIFDNTPKGNGIAVSSKEQVTVDTGCWPSRFVVYSYTNPDVPEDGEIEVMTTENCDTENWEADEQVNHPTEKKAKIFFGLTAFLKWLIALIKKIFKLG